MSDREQKTIVIRFALKIEVNGNHVEISQEPLQLEEQRQHKRTRSRSRSASKQATSFDPHRVGGKDPAHLYKLGLCKPPPPTEESGSSPDSSSCSEDSQTGDK